MTKQILILGLDRDARRTLLALYELTAQDISAGPSRVGGGGRQPRRVDAAVLARQLGVSLVHVMGTLQGLDARGLVWATRCRLTLQGLATAARLSSLRALAASRGRAA